jgi:putative iron-regulated protein
VVNARGLVLRRRIHRQPGPALPRGPPIEETTVQRTIFRSLATTTGVLLFAVGAHAQSGVQFLHCVPTAPGALTYQCSIAAPCTAAPCPASQWQAIAGTPTLPSGFFAPGGTRESAIQRTPVEIAGATYTLVNKDVGGQRWAIVQNEANGVVTGNVFPTAGGSGVQFLYCADASASSGSAVFGNCFLAAPCDTDGCGADDWQPIAGNPEVAASFFAPAAGRASGLQLTPTGEEILISKDLGAQRWTITTLAEPASSAFPLGIGPVFGNIFEAPSEEVTVENVLRTNAAIAFAVYSDAASTARALHDALHEFVDAPSPEAHAAAKAAWIAAREPYQQSEAFRFQAGPIDAIREDGTMGEDGEGPEGRINPWPLGEALIDYVAPAVDGNAGPESGGSVPGVSGNIVADAEHFPVLSPAVLAGLNEIGGDERNVATGYHAIEFLLWGQDLNADGTPGFGNRDATAGVRSYTDYLPEGGGCTNGNCSRRGQYLLAAADLLVEDLERVAAAWNPDGGVYYPAFVGGDKIALGKILEGMGRLGFGELAGERMNIALVANSQEDEHSCFSDNTHRDILLDALSIQNAYLGRYTRVDGALVSGPSPDALLRAQGDTAVADAMTAALELTMSKVAVIDARAKSGVPFDVQVQEGIEQPDIQAAIRALRDQIPPLEAVIDALDVITGDLCQDTEEFECD